MTTRRPASNKTMSILGLGYLTARSALPQLDGQIQVRGLSAPVSIIRDTHGVPTIEATSIEDLYFAQGYVTAQDRLWQMDLFRRISRGQLSEILGQKTLAIDKDFRTLDFSRAAERDVSLLDTEERKVYDAYARGVNKFIDQHWKSLPLEFSLLNYKPQPWQASDTLVIAAYMYRALTDTWERELNRAKVIERAGADRAKDLFSQEAAMDHFVVGDPNVQNDGSQRTATDPDDDSLPVPPGIAAQTRKVFDNLARVLKGCGLTLADVVSVRIFLTDFKRDYAAMNEIYATYFAADKRPARTTVGVTALARDGIVEIDLIAVRPSAQ